MGGPQPAVAMGRKKTVDRVCRMSGGCEAVRSLESAIGGAPVAYLDTCWPLIATARRLVLPVLDPTPSLSVFHLCETVKSPNLVRFQHLRHSSISSVISQCTLGTGRRQQHVTLFVILWRTRRLLRRIQLHMRNKSFVAR